MQDALRPWSASQDSGTAATQTSRMNKLMIGSIAALGASVIAVNPIAPSTAALEIQHRAVELVADVTGSPAAVYGELFTNTLTSLNGLGAQISANPLPILSALVANQEGYATK
ncbi:MAG: hypothetical protein JWM76_4259, partial [Pseudonocardiales bacterium]|nr:hypothetical protein [Pseudonocardiales bacterium]